MPRPEHRPQGDPCRLCKVAAKKHRKPRAYHLPEGDPCKRCKLAACAHRAAKDLRFKNGKTPRKAAKVRASPPAGGARRAGVRSDHPKVDGPVIIGIDGEGADTPDGRHVYTYLAAVNEFGEVVAEVANEKGLSHEECARMILSLPRRALSFGFMFSYDVTKIIEELPLGHRYRLVRPETRRSRKCGLCGEVWYLPKRECPACGEKGREVTAHVRYKGRGYDWFAGSFTVAEGWSDGEDAYAAGSTCGAARKKTSPHAVGARRGGVRSSTRQRKGWSKSVKIWDCFRFFGKSFVAALTDWKIGTDAERAEVLAMKNKRGAFDREDFEDVKRYCRKECHLLAQLMRKVITSHKEAKIPLTRYEGAGSTAAALLKKHKVGRYKGDPIEDLHPRLQIAILSAFFGGRFESPEIGCLRKPVHSHDVSSAYPYALTFLPCLKCGEWKEAKFRTEDGLRRQIERADLAVCSFKVKRVTKRERRGIAWGPLPFRDAKGSICYPTNFSGWAWAQEALPAKTHYPDLVKLTGAWLYTTTCEHKPFKFLPGVYRKRLEWGKEGPGIVLKLGPNACYGKCAQRVGDNPPYQSWPWAGACTATTRGQFLDAVATANDPWNVFAVATDGLLSTEKLDLARPESTNTFDCLDHEGKPANKPLGGWEHKEIPEGVFVAKPGLYFRLSPKLQLGEVRARGVGRKEVFTQRRRLIRAFARWDGRTPRPGKEFGVILKSRRFYGAKHSILAQSSCDACGTKWPGTPERGCPSCGLLGTSGRTIALQDDDGKWVYGTWGEREIKVSFNPLPKREALLRPKRIGSDASVRLIVRDVGGATSAPYGSRTTPEGQASQDAKEFALQQPDWEDPPTEMENEP